MRRFAVTQSPVKKKKKSTNAGVKKLSKEQNGEEKHAKQLIHQCQKMMIYQSKNISKYKDLEKELEKIWHLKTTPWSVIAEAKGMIEEETNNHINKIPGSPSLNTKKLHFVEQFISLIEFHQYDSKISLKRGSKMIKTYNIYI